MQSRYERMCQKRQNLASELTYFDFLLTALCAMFRWDGIPVEQRHLEEYLHTSTNFACQPSDKVPEGYLFAPDAGRDSMLDQFAEGLHVHGVTLGGGYQVDGIIDKEVLVCYNNSLHVMDFDIIQYANYLMTVDKAMLVNTKLSGFAPILCAQDSKSQKSLEGLIQSLLDGYPAVVKDAETFDRLLNDGKNPLYSISITEPQRAANVQYQSQLWFDFLKRFFAKYGIDVTTTNKRAQVTSEEINALDAYSWILPLDMLTQRQQFCDKANALWGTNWSCRFSDLWQIEFEKYVRSTMGLPEEGGEEDADNGDDSGTVAGDNSAAGES